MTKLPSQFKYRNKFWILLCVFVSLLGLYVFLVGKTMANGLSRQETESQISKLSSAIGELDYTYLRAKYSVNEELALSLGFAQSEKILIAKKGAGIGYNLKNEI